MSDHDVFFKYQYLVFQIAKKLHSQVRNRIELKDLVSIGNIGLLTALQSHKKSDKIIKNYLRIRIKGTMIDHLRKIGGNSREIVEGIIQVKKAYSVLRKKLNRRPCQTEAAKEIGISIEDYHKLRNLVLLSETSRYEEFLGEDDPFKNPENLVGIKLRVDLVKCEIEKLPPIFKMVFEYERGEQLNDYARRVGIEYPCLLWRKKQAIKMIRQSLHKTL